MSWALAHTDLILAVLMAIIAVMSYWMGKEAGYCEGLEDGFKDGKLND